MATPAQYRLGVECSDLRLEVRLNGLPVFSQAGGMRNRNALINHWIVDGRNTVSVLVAAPEGDAPADASPRAQIIITIDGAPAYTFNREPGASAKPLPLAAAGEFQSGASFGEWSWQRADTVGLNRATITEINAYLQRAFEVLNAADLGQTRALFRVKAEEHAVAFGIPTARHLQNQDDFFRDLFAQPNWAMEPINFERLEYTLYLGGRVLGVRYKDGSDVLRSKPFGDGEVFRIPLLLSKLNGQWTVVR
jgi:hypothetical protein